MARRQSTATKTAPPAVDPEDPGPTPPGETSKEIAREEPKELSTSVTSFEDDAGGGMEETDVDSYAIPFIALLQKGSPQVDEGDDAYVDGAKAGDFYNTVTNEVIATGKKGILVVPCHFRRSYVEWVPRDTGGGGGFVGQHTVEEGKRLLATGTHRDDKNRDIRNDTGNQLVDTRSHYVLLVKDDGDYEPFVITMTSTQLKKSRRWMTQMSNIKGRREDGSRFTMPSFSQIYCLKSVREENDKGSWYGWDVTHEAQIDLGSQRVLYEAAKDFRSKVASGAVQVSQPVAEAPAANAQEAGF